MNLANQNNHSIQNFITADDPSGAIIMHRGIVKEIDNDVIRVSILSMSACASCHAKGYCTLADQKEKIIEAPNPHSAHFKIGDHVNVTMKKSMGTKAVFYGYFLPFILILSVLLIIYELTGNQGLAGLLALAVTLPYYAALYFFRNKLKSGFKFELQG
ncbi:MAG TPA: SoxR reducing system RseC family protein [Bacteroidales bacterium]|nr:SoxR reducing system RseC family protein [Bacteroidales bacterium]HRW97398.1 SoxR reducing system RseC family protein [Bacteroidales bacterium]